ncbi:hypothetical protein [Pseudomonas aeruginosa]|uniref:hypothetical protein n=2 Tax=Pseudomonas aeruginosa TaxID=287 RepID=UPI003CFFA85A
MSKELNKAPVEQAGGDELEKFLAWACKEYGIEDKYDLNENHHSIRENKKGWMARAALAQPSPAQTQPSPAPTLRAAIDVANDRFEVPVAKWGTDLVGEEERPEVAEVAFVLRNIGAMDAEDIDGDNVDLRFEDAEGRDTGCDVSIVEYAEKAADLFEQHDRIVGELRADRDSWAEQAEQRLADWDEMRKERDAALVEVERLSESKGDPVGSFEKCMKVMYERDENAKRLEVALARVAELEAHCVRLGQGGAERYWENRWRDADARLQELERQQPVAWMHDQPNRVDVIHRDVKDLLQRVPGSSRGIYRPLDVSEHYTIPLYAAPVAQAQHSVPEISGIGRDAEHPRAVVLYLRNEPSEEDMRAIQNFLRAISADVLTQAQHSAGYAEARMCANCLHIGINDAADSAACHDCNWTGPEPDEDKCPGCAGENCMAAACPECGGRYDLVAEANITAPAGQVPQAWLDVQAERRRQITAEGWTPEHDDLYCAAELPRAAAAYILNGANDEAPAIWPFVTKWWKPRDARSNYVRAGALILAEIERLDRARQGGRS